MSNIFVKSIFGAMTKLPLVEITFEDIDLSKPLVISPDEARAVAHNIIHAAEASEQDAFLMDFLTNRVGMSMQEAGAILIDFREQRQSKEKDDAETA